MKNEHSNKKILKEIFNCKDVSEALDKSSIRTPEKIFIYNINEKKKISFYKFNNLVNKCCNFFLSKKIKQKDIISIKTKNCAEFLIIYFACIRYKSIINPIPSTISDYEFLDKINFIRPKLIFVDNSSKLKKKNIINISSDFNKSFLNYLSINFSNKFTPINKFNYKNTAVLYYSSGTTNNPKIIEYSYRSMIELQKSMIRQNFTYSKTNHLCILPFGHTSVLRYSIKQAAVLGSTIFITDNFWKIKSDFFKIISKKNINYIQLVPSLASSIFTINSKYIFNKKLVFGCGSSYLSKSLQIEFEKKFSTKLLNLYGLSEIGASHLENPKKRKLGSIGKPLDIYDFKILNKNNKFCKNNELGELIVKGKALFNGYFKNPKLTRQSFYKKYFKTGDIGFKDKDGYYYYADRKKDLIIKGGVNILPSEIDEAILKSNKNVLESSTIGVKDIFYGEIIKSFIVLKKKDKLIQSKLKNNLVKKLGNFKSPDIIIVKKKFPKTASGKIIKRLIDDE